MKVEALPFLVRRVCVTVYVGKVMGAIITDHGLPCTLDLHFKLDRETNHFAPFGLMEVPLSSVLS